MTLPPKLTRAERLRQASRERRTQEKQELRQEIINAASALFLQHGYEGFSLRQVAEQIAHSPGTIYLYFENKDDLLFAVANAGFQEFGRRLHEAAQSTEDAFERVLAMGQAYVAFGLQHPAYYRLMFMERPEFLVQKANTGETDWVNTLRVWQQAVEAAAAAGQIQTQNPASTSDAVWALMHGLVSFAHRMPGFDEQRFQHALDSALDLIRAGLTR